jgi:hypothetical protein
MPLSYGICSGSTRFLRRTSAGSWPIAAAKRSMSRSVMNVASARPEPRWAPSGTVFVNAAYTSQNAVGMA